MSDRTAAGQRTPPVAEEAILIGKRVGPADRYQRHACLPQAGRAIAAKVEQPVVFPATWFEEAAVGGLARQDSGAQVDPDLVRLGPDAGPDRGGQAFQPRAEAPHGGDGL